MDIFEFELRYLAYKWLSKRYRIELDEEITLKLVKRTKNWQLTKKLIETTPDELRELTVKTYSNLKKKYIEENKEKYIWEISISTYIERLEYELKVIKEMWYNTYFLIVQDYINRAKCNDISVWPWRWSAAWSLLAYLIWITDLDPLVYDLLFERFLNPARISMPDIDTDFEDIKREKILEYVKDKYWNDKVASIWTYMSMAAKAAFKDVARVYWIPFEQSNKISNLITEKTIKKSYDENEEFQSTINWDDKLKQIYKIANNLEWTIRQTWVHACWVIISPTSVTDYTPIQFPPKSWSRWEKDTTRRVSQYDWHFLEDIWLLKMDFLWLRNLSIIKNTVKILKARYDVQKKDIPEMFKIYLETNWFYPPLNDQKTYARTFQVWDTNWVFQFESDWMKAWLKKLLPNNIDDIIAMVSLYRPWPMEFIPNYIDRKNWTEKVDYLMEDIYNTLKDKYWKDVADDERKKITQDLSPFMDVTYWIPVYQEQLMRIVQAMAWFSLWEADLLRRWVWKKIKEIVEKIKIDFIKRAEDLKWYKQETSTYVYEKMIEPAANYSFNKSHAACYAYIAYQTAYLKAHYPIEFNAALLWSVEEETDKLAKFIDDLKMQWYEIRPPHVNESYTHVAAIDNHIRIWFLAIKWVWYEVAKTIENERIKNWKYKSIEDFLKRCSSIVNKKSIESLCKSWAFDWFIDRKTWLHNVNQIIEYWKSTNNNWWWFWLFDMWDSINKIEFKEVFKSSLMEKLLFELEIFKTFISSHPFDWMYRYIKWKYNFISMFKDVEDYWEFNIIWFVKDIRRVPKKWFFINLEDISWDISIFVKSISDISDFDILVIKWYKWKSIRIKEASRIWLDQLVQKAKKSWKYNENENVMEVRWKRLSSKNNKESIQNDNTNEDNIDQNKEKIDNKIKKNEDIINNEGKISEKEIIETKPKEKHKEDLPISKKTSFKMPETVQKINELIDILKNNKWDIIVQIWINKYLVNNIWLEKINNLLS